MMRIPARTAAIVAAFLAFASAAHAEGWKRYRNDRFGVSADYPADWTMGPEPANDDGRQFFSPDAQASLTISGMFAVDGRAEEMAEKARPLDGENVTYSAKGANWLALSGTRGDKIFYRKSLLSCRNQVWNDVEIEYAAEDKSKYDALVAHVAASLKPGKGFGVGCEIIPLRRLPE